MKYFKWYTWVGIGLVFFILTITLGKMTVFIKDVTHTEAMSVQVNSEKIDSDMQMETETKESDSFTSTITIPYTHIEEVDKQLHNWTKSQERHFYEETESIKDPLFKKKKESYFTVDSDLSKLTDDIYQIKLELTQSMDGENETTFVKTLAFDKADGKSFIFDEIMKNDKKNIKRFSKLWKKYAEGKVNEDKLKEKLSEVNQLNWIIDKKKEEMVFYFDENELTNRNEAIHIPFIDIYKNFSDDYEDILISEALKIEIAGIKAEKKRQKEKELQQSKKIAITFDDGPHGTATNQILNALDKYDAKATFFMLSKNVKLYPDIAKEVVDKGHEIGNHSISHANLKAVSDKKAKQEVIESADTIEEITGVKTTLFRPPYGNYTDKVINFAEESNQSIILWSIDTRDWDNRSAQAIYQNTVQKARPGSIILMHDIHIKTAGIVPKILKTLSDEGYEFVTVSELMPLIKGEDVGPYYGN